LAENTLTARIAALSNEKRALLRRRVGQRSINGLTLVAESLLRLGITHVYSVSGTPIDGILPACAERGIRLIGVHHQQAAVMMAAAQNYVAGRLIAAVVVSAGPAVTNTTTGVLVAHDNGWPVLVLAGRRPVVNHGIGYFQELEAVSVLRSITRRSSTVSTTDAIPEQLREAARLAVSGRPGPVFLELTEDVLNGTIFRPCLDSLSGEIPTPLPCDDARIDQAASLLLRADRPVMIVGKGVRWTVDTDALRALVEELGIPFITSPMGRGFLPDDHPLCCNAVRTLAQARADVALVVAARLNWMFRYGNELALDARIIQVDVQREELGRNREAAVALHGDAGQCIAQLLERTRKRGASRERAARRPWHRELERADRSRRRELDALASSDSMPMSAYRLAGELRGLIPHDAIFVADGNVCMVAAQQIVPSQLPASRLDTGTNGCLGVGIPFALGAKLARPERPAIALCGDYAFSLAAMELETCARHDIPIVVVVANNHGLCGSFKQKNVYPSDHRERVTMFQPEIRYDELARTLGCHGELVERPEELRPALERALGCGRPACLNVFIDPDTPIPNAWGNTT
jgi:2-hydroxyacyl-CoA lyase 1